MNDDEFMASAGSPLRYDNLRLDTKHLWPQSFVNVLEVGCGPARLSRVLECESYWGVEPDLAAAEAGRANNSARVQILHLDYAAAVSELPKRFFDFVICHDSIEHLPDHEHFFRTLPSLCASGASLVLTIPNMRHMLLLYNLLVRQDWPYGDTGLMDRTHLRWFTAKSLEKVLVKHGYEIEVFEFKQPTFFTNNPFKVGLLRLASMILGDDSRYVYFALRVRVPAH